MNQILNILSISSEHHWIVDLVIQSTLVLSIALLANFLLRRQSAARRYLLLLAAAVSLPLLLASSIMAPRWQLFDVSEFAPSGTVDPAIEVRFERQLVAGEAILEGKAARPEPLVSKAPVVESRKHGLSVPLTGIWLGGAGLLFAKLALGALALRRIGGAECAASVKELLSTEARAMGISSPPKLLRLGERAMPMTWGLRRHVIALPSGADTWPTERLRRVLRHELAHVARRDFATGCLVSLCLAPLWFHPLAWCLKAALVRTREGACDDLALDGFPRGERDAYVRDLVDIIGAHQRAHRRPGMAIALAMGSGRKRTIKRRLVAILDERRDRRATPKRMLWWGAPLWGAAAVGIGALTALPQVVAQKASVPEGTIVGEPVKKSYSLVQAQLDGLMPKAAQQDPFAADPFGGSVPAKARAVDLETASAYARNELISRFGIRIGTADPVEIEFESRFKLVVTAPPHIQKSIVWVLDSLLGATQVQLSLHVFEIDDPKWLAEQMGGSIHPSAGKLIGRDEFEKLRGEYQKKAKGSKTMPSILTKSGQRCKVENIKEFIYPTEYDPPELPVSADGDPKFQVTGGTAVTPANPTAFDVRNVGLTWEIEPVVMENGAVEFNTSIEDCQFEGFINYGSEINGIVSEEGKQKAVTLTDNRILQPVFSVSRVSTSFVLPPGKLVALQTLAPRVDQSVRDAIISEGAVDSAADPDEAGSIPVAEEKLKTAYLYIIEAKVIEKGE